LTNIKTRKNTVCITANDTSTGIEYTAKEISAFKKLYPNKALLVDATSSF
jgi:aspartate aminotransferase-like enzyme